MFFAQSVREAIKTEIAGIAPKDIMTETGKRWAALSDSQKAVSGVAWRGWRAEGVAAGALADNRAWGRRGSEDPSPIRPEDRVHPSASFAHIHTALPVPAQPFEEKANADKKRYADAGGAVSKASAKKAKEGGAAGPKRPLSSYMHFCNAKVGPPPPLLLCVLVYHATTGAAQASALTRPHFPHTHACSVHR